MKDHSVGFENAQDPHSAITVPKKREPSRTLLPAPDEGPIKAVDPQRAAKARAQARKRSDGTASAAASSRGILDEIADAEEDYEEPEEAMNDGGIPIEPFHLRNELLEGFFDAMGNYIAFRNDDDTDAWLESLDDQISSAKHKLAKKALARGRPSGEGTSSGPGGASGDAEGGDLDDEADAVDDRNLLGEEAVAVYRRRVMDLLQPGETVLDALRRLGRRPRGVTTAQSMPTAGSRQRAKRQRIDEEQQQQQQQQQATTLDTPSAPPSLGTTPSASAAATPSIATSATKAAASALADATEQPKLTASASNTVSPADADTAMEVDPSAVQSMDPASASLIAGAAASKLASAAARGASRMSREEAEVRESGYKAGGSSGGSGGGGGGGGSRPKTPKRGEEPAVKPTLRPGRRVPPEHRQVKAMEFEKLTEYADLLLSGGDFNIYMIPRESLIPRPLPPPPSRQHPTPTTTAPPTTASLSQTHASLADTETTSQTQEGAGLTHAAALLSSLTPQAEFPVIGGLSSAQQPSTSQHTHSPAHDKGDADDDDEDMFGDGAAEPTGASAEPAQVQASVSLQHTQPAAPVSLPHPIQACSSDDASSQPGAVAAAEGTSLHLSSSAAAAAAMETAAVSSVPTGDGSNGMAGQAAECASGAQTGSDSGTAPASTPEPDPAENKKHLNGSIASDRTTAGGEGSEAPALPAELAGFEFQRSSGYFYNASIGYFYDPATQLFGEASSGQWYSYTDGAYLPVKTAGGG
ncbi:MAG: hypothetical protein WDW38_005362 [Sanguina aurantia]